MTSALRDLLKQVAANPEDDFLAHIAAEAAADARMDPRRVERLLCRVQRAGQWKRLADDARTLIALGHPDRGALLNAVARTAKVGRGCPLKVLIRHRNLKPTLRRFVVTPHTGWPPPAVVVVGAIWLVQTHARIGTTHTPKIPRPQSLAESWGGFL